MSSARTPRKPPRPGQKPGNTSTPPKKKPGTSFMMSDGTGIEVIDDELFYHDSDGNLRSYPPPNILQRFVTWIRNILSSDLSRTSEGWFMAGKSKRKERREINRSPMMASYEHGMCDIYEEEWRREGVVIEWRESHHWARRLMDWMFGKTYSYVDIPDSYFDDNKSKQSTEQMATLGELFEGYEDEITASEDELHQIKLAWDAMEAAHRPLVLLPWDFKPHHKELEQLIKDNAQARHDAIKEHSETMEQLQKDYSRRRYNLERERGTDHTKG